MRPRNIALAAVGLALFEASRIGATSRTLHPAEVRVFRTANEAADELGPPVRAVMQLGTFGSVPALAAVLVAIGRKRAAAEILVSGTAAWVLAKKAKPLAGRPRPALVLGSVRTRESIAGDLGWVSGHVTVSTTLALTLAPAVPRWAYLPLAGAVAITGFGRMYVGAHLPLDLLGGAGLGMMIASAVRAVG